MQRHKAIHKNDRRNVTDDVEEMEEEVDETEDDDDDDEEYVQITEQQRTQMEQGPPLKNIFDFFPWMDDSLTTI